MRDYSNRKIDYKNRKPKPINYDTILQIRIDKDLKEKLYQESQKNHVAASEMLRYILQRYFDDTYPPEVQTWHTPLKPKK